MYKLCQMKRVCALLLAITFVVTMLAACGNDAQSNNTQEEPPVEILPEVTLDDTAPPDDTLAGDEGKPFEEMALDFFIEISKIPRGSHNEQAISDWLVAFGTERGLETIQDDALNVLIKKPGTPGRENEPAVILQAHMDMVCEKNDDVMHDFASDPIIPIIENGWVYADGTTLGADDGAGMAMILAVLDADYLSHPPIEALITTNEEAGMTGAMAFDTSLLSGMRLINLDAEDEGVFYVSTAASADVDVVIPIVTTPLPDEEFVSYELAIRGLRGGHSGVDIDKGRANANVLSARILSELPSIYLTSISGGSARNAIPRECTAVISIDSGDFDAIQMIVSDMEAAFKAEYPEDPDLSITLVQIDAPDEYITTSRMVIDTISETPNGVISMSSEIEGLVQTSNNVGVVITEGDTVTISSYPRSSNPTEQAETIDAIRDLADAIGAEIIVGNENPAWPYNPNSPLREQLTAIFVQMYDWEPSHEAVHAALECGLFAGSVPDMDMISIGPDIENAHSPDERMSLASFHSMCDFLIEVLSVI